MQTNYRGAQAFFLAFAFLMFFLGIYLGWSMWHVNENKRVAELVSCAGYENDFITKMGYQDRDSCVQLNMALHREYTDQCLSSLKRTEDEALDEEYLDKCIYYKFENNALSMSSEYAVYKRSQ